MLIGNAVTPQVKYRVNKIIFLVMYLIRWTNWPLLIKRINFLVDGNWGEWEPSTECSKSCGGGTQERTRSCSDPSPEYGGSNCTSSDEITAVGDEQVETDIATCNDFPCPKPPKGMFELSDLTETQSIKHLLSE